MLITVHFLMLTFHVLGLVENEGLMNGSTKSTDVSKNPFKTFFVYETEPVAFNWTIVIYLSQSPSDQMHHKCTILWQLEFE